MIRRILLFALLLAPALGCEYQTEPSATRIVPANPPAKEKRGDVHIQAPGVNIDIQRKATER